MIARKLVQIHASVTMIINTNLKKLSLTSVVNPDVYRNCVRNSFWCLVTMRKLESWGYPAVKTA